jgi:hypothetical protein
MLRWRKQRDDLYGAMVDVPLLRLESLPIEALQLPQGRPLFTLWEMLVDRAQVTSMIMLGQVGGWYPLTFTLRVPTVTLLSTCVVHHEHRFTPAI